MSERAAAALTWDGVRYPTRKLPAKARAFLGAVTPAARWNGLLKKEAKIELRICWVPRLRGGPHTLCPPFAAPDGAEVVPTAITRAAAS